MYQDRERQAQKEFKMYRICANYDVICFDYVDDVQVIEHEYFDTYEEAQPLFGIPEQKKF